MSHKCHRRASPFKSVPCYFVSSCRFAFCTFLLADSKTPDRRDSVPCIRGDESASSNACRFQMPADISHRQSGRKGIDPPRSSREADRRSSFRALWLSAIRVMYLGGPGFTAGRKVHSASASGQNQKALEGTR